MELKGGSYDDMSGLPKTSTLLHDTHDGVSTVSMRICVHINGDAGWF